MGRKYLHHSWGVDPMRERTEPGFALAAVCVVPLLHCRYRFILKITGFSARGGWVASPHPHSVRCCWGLLWVLQASTLRWNGDSFHRSFFHDSHSRASASWSHPLLLDCGLIKTARFQERRKLMSLPPRLMLPWGRQKLEVPGPLMWSYFTLRRAPGRDKWVWAVARGPSTSR